MNGVERSVEVKRRGQTLGFDAVGIATLEPNTHADELDAWLAAGHAGTMAYLHRQAAQRKHPARIIPDARVAVVTLTNYFHGSADPGPPARGQGKVAQYAWSPDYHAVLGRRLEQLATAIRDGSPGAKTRCYVDAGPVPERDLAQRAGLGWIGKNMMLIDPELGSFTFIGVVLTDAPLAPRPDLGALDLAALLDDDAPPRDFDRRFGDTPLERPALAGLRRNAAAVLHNRGRPSP